MKDYSAIAVLACLALALFLVPSPYASDLPQVTIDDGESHRLARSTRPGIAVRMTFEVEPVGAVNGDEGRLPSRQHRSRNDQETTSRSGLPLHGSAFYEELYPGIDLRLRQAHGAAEYELLVQPDADLSQACVLADARRFRFEMPR